MAAFETIAVAMSGGVDSSTVAAMLRADGYNLVGLTMQLWNQRRLAGREGMPEAVQGRCCSLDDVYDARRVAETIGIPYYVVNHEQRFEQEVVRPFVSEYLSGRTAVLALQSGEPGPVAQVIAGIDLAVLDLQARRARLPLWRLLGGECDEITVYASGLNPTGVEAIVSERLTRGFDAFKLN